MRKFFYARLAGGNIRRNSSTYYPFILASIGLIAIYYNVIALATNPDIAEMPGAGNVSVMFTLGSVVLGIFSVMLLVYANSFVIKRRKKELGLYNVLGMEKRHIARLFLDESLISSGLSLGLGLGAGALFSRLTFLLLERVLQFSRPLRFSLRVEPFSVTSALFAGIFVLIYLFNLLRIRRLNPIDLLMGSRAGEKEPKASWLIAVAGLVLLGGGYYMAIIIEEPFEAFAFFFIAVTLVILGTYALFISGSIFILKVARKNKGLYYKPENFISISGMIYRMKQNAAGLAGICILCTMVLVAVSTTVCLYTGSEDTLAVQYPFDINISAPMENGAAVREIADAFIARENMEVTNFKDYHLRAAFGYVADGAVRMTRYSYNDVPPNSMIYMMPLADYNAYAGQSTTLEPGEILLSTDRPEMFPDEVTIGKNAFRVKETLPAFFSGQESLISTMVTCIIILPDVRDMEFTLEDADEESYSAERFLGYDLNADTQTQIDFAAALRAELNSRELLYHDENKDFILSCRADFRAEWHSIYGGFLFLGIFLGLVFTTATALMIYYKQISEGFDDHERFEIMQKVGMSRQEVKGTIDKQIRFVFFLPLAAAILHIVFAFNMIRRLLMIFSLNNVPLFIACMGGTALVFSLVYLSIYRATARSYYKLV